MVEVKGVVQSVVPWKSGKGYFIKVDDVDYYAWKSPTVCAGDEVSLSAKAGTLKDKDTLEVTSLLVIGQSQLVQDSVGVVAPEAFGDSFELKLKKEAVIIVQCVQAAYGALQEAEIPDVSYENAAQLGVSMYIEFCKSRRG
jgi:hypothetical protein